jgi:hypothetical protein
MANVAMTTSPAVQWTIAINCSRTVPVDQIV